ncbi:TPA: hypothetical protein QC291_001571 [Bacillus cereus]|uniref:hypothetical protein n=1 Tax=Bacillus TaxID=1386 RepID=UPI00077A4D88|nr:MULTISPECIES: hypothetical protein [Bacillus]KXY95140.1 hypothetical protein AT279_21720 [Bacillus cereus]SDJ70135.1 hypothetical protein SAMN04488578_11982 [Bacillus sp. cl96]SEB14968.1 hypothetical protein SAMN04488575_12045 [Bacillus sp. cl115]SHK25995.1 hypothetical protein SAMN04488576_12181 [Bacillus sp. cl25]HDR8199930.1 hypothetical protein [Bacillus cereus]
MAYIDADYYTNIYKGMPVEDPDMLNRMIARASDVIDQIINYKLSGVDFDKLAPFIKEQIMKATAAQTEYIALYGETSANTMIDTPVMQVGKFRYGLLRGGKSEGPGKDARIAQGTIAFLRPTGLLNSSIDILC